MRRLDGGGGGAALGLLTGAEREARLGGGRGADGRLMLGGGGGAFAPWLRETTPESDGIPSLFSWPDLSGFLLRESKTSRPEPFLSLMMQAGG
jgi:hypothetical protein